MYKEINYIYKMSGNKLIDLFELVMINDDDDYSYIYLVYN